MAVKTITRNIYYWLTWSRRDEVVRISPGSDITQGMGSTAKTIDFDIINAGEGNDIVDLVSTNFILTNGVNINGWRW